MGSAVTPTKHGKRQEKAKPTARNWSAYTIKTIIIMSKTKTGTLYYQLYKSNANNQTANKWYARVKHMGTVSFDELVEHMAEHNIGTSRGTIHAVMLDFIDCLNELLAEGKKVELADLGTFALNIRNKQGAASYKGFSAAENIESCGLDFYPSQKKASDMSRAAWTNGISFKNFTSLLSDAQRYAYYKEVGAEEMGDKTDTTE